jgi:hypothetical protein
LGGDAVMSVRSYKWITGILLCLALFLAWRSFVLYRQMVTVAFIDRQCQITQDNFINGEIDPRALAQRLDFLICYYDGYSKDLSGSPVAHAVWRSYCQTLTNAVNAFRLMTTNDLGSDPKVWIKKYEP